MHFLKFDLNIIIIRELLWNFYGTHIKPKIVTKSK